jgi:ABC-type hemin transport system substrate-binding protein
MVVCPSLLALTACEKANSTPGSTPGPATPTAVAEPRLVVLSPALAVIVRDVGLGQCIVGRHAWDLALDPALPVCGDQAGIDFESLLKIKPTHIVLQWGDRALPQRLLDLSKQQGWMLINENPLTLDDIPAVARSLTATFSLAIEARHARPQADALLASLDAACSTTDESPWKGRVLLLASTSPPAALGPGSWHAEILSRMGATPAIITGKVYQTLDAEDLIKLAPDAIVLIQPRGTKQSVSTPRNVLMDFDPADLTTRLGLLAPLDLPARRAGRIALIDDPLALTPSTSIIEFRRRMREILAAWAAADAKN